MEGPLAWSLFSPINESDTDFIRCNCSHAECTFSLLYVHCISLSRILLCLLCSYHKCLVQRIGLKNITAHYQLAKEFQV